MITLFISRYEMVVLSFFIVMALYAISKYMLAIHIELSAKIRKMSDEELWSRFDNLSEDYEQKATYLKGQELAHILEEWKKRKLLKNMTNSELAGRYQQLATEYEQTPTFWKKKELTLFRTEVEKRSLL